MDVTLLGTGDATGVPPLLLDCEDCDAEARRRRPGILVETTERTVLFDASPDLPEQLREADVDRIDAALLTHWHHDHAGGVEELGIVAPALDLDLYLTRTATEHLRTERPHLDDTFEIRPLEHDEPVEIGDLEITPFPVAHGRPEFDTLGFAITHDDSTAVYAPDIGRFRPDRSTAYRDADLLFVEGTGLYRPDSYDHDTDFEAMIERAGATRTVLIHLNEAYLGRSTAALREVASAHGYELGADFATYSP